MAKHNVQQVTNTALQEVKGHSFVVKRNDAEEELAFDYGFICLGMRANAPIYTDLVASCEDTDTEIINIGDSVRARRIIDGTWAGRHQVLATLERLGYLD